MYPDEIEHLYAKNKTFKYFDDLRDRQGLLRHDTEKQNPESRCIRIHCNGKHLRHSDTLRAAQDWWQEKIFATNKTDEGLYSEYAKNYKLIEKDKQPNGKMPKDRDKQRTLQGHWVDGQQPPRPAPHVAHALTLSNYQGKES